MAIKVRRVVKLTFPQRLIKEPVTFKMAKKYGIIPNIRRARVTEKIGEMILDLDGEEKNVEKGFKYLAKFGVKIEPVEEDIIE